MGSRMHSEKPPIITQLEKQTRLQHRAFVIINRNHYTERLWASVWSQIFPWRSSWAPDQTHLPVIYLWRWLARSGVFD